MNGSLLVAELGAAPRVVLAICISESRPSCMRAPPLAVKQTNGSFCSRQTCTPRTKRSPTTEPIEPPRNRIRSGDDQRHGLDAALHHDQRVVFAGVLARLLEALGVAPAVLELERVDRQRLRRRSRSGLRRRAACRAARARRCGCGGRTSGRRAGSSRGRCGRAPPRTTSHLIHSPSGTPSSGCRRRA